MSLRALLYLAGISVLPGIELRGAIPVGIGLGHHWGLVFLVAVLANCLIIVPEFYALDLFYDRVLSRRAWFRRWMVERVRRRGAGMIQRYGLLGLALFVALPLPGTGAYSGALLAWLLGLDRGRSIGAITAGVVVAGVAVTLAATGVFAALRRLL